jgi:hypothetical protein
MQTLPNINQIAVHDAKTLPRMLLSGHSVRHATYGTSLYVDGLSATSKLKEDIPGDVPGFSGSLSGATMGINLGAQGWSYGVGYSIAMPSYTSLGNDYLGTIHMGSLYVNYAPSDATTLSGMLFAGGGGYDAQGLYAGAADSFKVNYQLSTMGLGLKGAYALGSRFGIYVDTTYVSYSQGAYIDNLDQKIDAVSDSIMTAGAGFKVFKLIKRDEPAGIFNITPNFTAGVVYDVMPGTMNAVITKAGGTPYRISGQDIAELGFRVGFGADMEIQRFISPSVIALGFNLSANYAMEIRDTLSMHEIIFAIKSKM